MMCGLGLNEIQRYHFYLSLRKQIFRNKTESNRNQFNFTESGLRLFFYSRLSEEVQSRKQHTHSASRSLNPRLQPWETRHENPGITHTPAARYRTKARQQNRKQQPHSGSRSRQPTASAVGVGKRATHPKNEKPHPPTTGDRRGFIGGNHTKPIFSSLHSTCRSTELFQFPCSN